MKETNQQQNSILERPLPPTPASSEQEEAKAPVIMEEWREKYDRLQNLFQEKSAELEKIQSQLEGEISHRKDFDKIKDILEKELTDTKSKLKNLQTELSTFNQDAEQYKTKIKGLELQLLGKQNEVNKQSEEQKNV